MASKQTRIDRLRKSHELVQRIQKEVDDFSALEALAEQTKNTDIIQKMKNAKSRVLVSLNESSQARAYHLGKAIEENAEMFDKVLTQVLS